MPSDFGSSTTNDYKYSIFAVYTPKTQPIELAPQRLIGNPYVFTGRRFDLETGLYYYRARYYNPHIGRFLQTDPVGYGDGINWYSYCGNNPINYLDPSGLFTIIWEGNNNDPYKDAIEKSFDRILHSCETLVREINGLLASLEPCETHDNSDCPLRAELRRLRNVFRGIRDRIKGKRMAIHIRCKSFGDDTSPAHIIRYNRLISVQWWLEYNTDPNITRSDPLKSRHI
jgi:RHS repeat-associated protein